MVSSVGCYAVKPIKDTEDAEGNILVINAESRYMYELNTWKVLENNDILGEGTMEEDVLGLKRVSAFKGIIEADEIETLAIKQLSLKRTFDGFLVNGVIVAAITGTIFMVYLSANPPHFGWR